MGYFNSLAGSSPGSVSNLTLDGIHFIAPRVFSLSKGANTNGAYDLADDLGRGLSWRIAPGTPGFRTYDAQDAYMMAVAGVGNSTNTLIQNCYFNGYGRAFSISGGSGFTFQQNTTIDLTEDFFFIGGGSNITIQWNRQIRSQPVSMRDAYLGWDYGKSVDQVPPPHSDWCQLYGKTTNFVYQYNDIFDDTERCHPLLCKIRDGGPQGGQVIPQSGWHVGVKVINNYCASSHGTQLWVSHSVAPMMSRNKGIKVGGSPSLQVSQETVVNATVTNNVGASLHFGPNPDSAPNDPVPGWTKSGNQQTNDINVLPSGWVEVRQSKVSGGARFAGQYGNSGGVSPPPPPPPPPTSTPIFTTLPLLRPTPTVVTGGRLTATPAVADGDPNPTTSHRWFRGGVLDASITGTTYDTVTGDNGVDFTYRTRANNGVGGNVDSAISNTVRALSPPPPPPPATAPSFFTAPDLNPNGSVLVGAVITATQASATGGTPITLSNRWFRGGILNSAVTGLTYTTGTPDLGAAITYRTRASNSGGTIDSALSDAVMVLSPPSPPPPPPPPPPTLPDPLTSGQVEFRELVPDPTKPNDARRTFTITVPASSPAADAVAFQWSSAADDDVGHRAMVKLDNVGTDRVWRAQSNSSTSNAHLRFPEGTFDTVHLYYQLAAGGQFSLASTYTFTVTVPFVGDPDPDLTQVIDLDFLRRAITTEGDAFQIVTKDRGVIWTKP
jgi:hypothetical protein